MLPVGDPREDLIMPSFDPELIQVMRAALDDVMTRIPVDQATPEVKVRVADSS